MKWHGILAFGICMSASALLAQTRTPAPGSTTRPGTLPPAATRPSTPSATSGTARPSAPSTGTNGTGTAPKAGATSTAPGRATGTAGAAGTAGTAGATGTARPGTSPAGGNLNLTARDYASYAIGLDMAGRFQAEGTTINLDQLILGLKDGFSGGNPRYPEQQLRAAAEAFDKELQARAQERFQQVSEKNKKDSAVFLAENKKKKTVKTTASGLQYEVVKSGTGAGSPKVTDTIKANYHGTLLDGTVFDSTQGDQPVVIEVSSAIPGWTEALQLMKAGDKWRLYVPPELAYGSEGFGPVPPNAVLIFDLELLEISKPAASTPVGQGTLPRQIK